jgi:arylsulfatase A-like enzyme
MRNVIHHSLPLFAFLLGCPFSALLADTPRMNVVIMLADDLGWADTSLYGKTKYHRTPNLDRLARLGMTFTQAYSASPLCSPTRSALITGLSTARTGITTPNGHLPQVVLQATVPKTAAVDQKAIMPNTVTRLKPEYQTLAESLKSAGYATGHFGKWHLGTEPYSPLQQGFDVDLPHWHGPGPAGSYVAPWKFKDFDHDPAIPDEHIEDRMAKEAVKFLEKNRDRPFFLNYWMFSVHAPFNAKQKLIEKYRATANPADPQHSPTYAAMIESMDDAVGTLLDTLDRLKIADRTIIIFTSDNGGNMYSPVDGTTPTSNAPLRGGKATLFEGGTRVPCVVAWPGITQPGSTNPTIVQSEDYYPTLLDGLGLNPAKGQLFDGISIMQALRGQPMQHPPVFQFFPHSPPVPEWLPPAVSVHDGPWKLIRIFHGGEKGRHRYLLYNLNDDISESKNLAAENPQQVARLDTLISSFLTHTGAVVPQPNPAFNPASYRPELEGKGKIREEEKARAKAKTQTTTKKPADDEFDPSFKNWKPRGLNATVTGGNLVGKSLGPNSFLGFAAGKHSGPTIVRFKIRSNAAKSHLDWLPGGAGSAASSVNYEIKSPGWNEMEVAIPAQDRIGVLRIYLPQPNNEIQIDWIEIRSDGGKTITRTDF